METFHKICLVIVCLALWLPISGCSGSAEESEQETSAAPLEDPIANPPVDTIPEKKKKK